MAKKKKINVVYSTNPDFNFDYDEDENEETLPPGEQNLYVSIDRKQRKGKEVTLVEGFVGDPASSAQTEVRALSLFFRKCWHYTPGTGHHDASPPSSINAPGDCGYDSSTVEHIGALKPVLPLNIYKKNRLPYLPTLLHHVIQQ